MEVKKKMEIKKACKITHQSKIILYQRRYKQLRNKFTLGVVVQ